MHEQKLRAALAARADPDTLIVARTDAIAVTGLDDAIARAHRYADAGADVIFVDAPRSEDELRAIGAAGIGKPLLVNVSEYGRTPDLGAAAFEAARLLDRPVSDFDAVRGLAVDQGARRLAARDGHDARHRAAHDAVRRAQRDARQRRMGRGSVSANETVFTVAGTPLVFGPGCSLETGWHLRRAGVTRALVVTDPHLAAIGLIDPVVEAIRAAGVEAEVFAGSGVEPSEASVTQAIEAAREGGFDGFVGLGGGSSIDTAKIAALLSTHPGGIYDYLNPPIGKGTPVPGPLLPLFGVPTTGGTGAEATTVAIIDLPEHHVKTGISHAHLRPLLGIVDPDLTLTTPSAVTASVGLDVLCHAIESYTAIAYDARPRASAPDQRPPYQGANPVSDVWSEQAIALAGGALRNAIADGSDHAARSAMALAASAAGRGLRAGRSAHSARLLLSRGGPQARVEAARVPGRGALRAARLRRRADRTRVVPLHRARGPRAAPARS